MNTPGIRPLLFTVFALAIPFARAQNLQPDFPALIARHESMSPAPLLDRNLFIQNDAIKSVKLSPDGKYVAYSLNDGLQVSLYLLDTVSMEKTRLLNKSDLKDFFWTTDSAQLILDMGNAVGRISPATGRNAAFVTTLDRGKGDRFIGLDQSAENRVLVVRKPSDNEYVLERYPQEGGPETVLTTEKKIRNAIFPDGGITAVVMTEEESGPVIYALDRGTLRPLHHCPIPAGAEVCRMIGIDTDRNALWLATNTPGNFMDLYRMSLDDGELELAHSDPAGRVDLRSWATMRGRPVIARYHDGSLKNYGLDETTQHLVTKFQAAFPDSNISPEPDDDGGTWLLTEWGDRLIFPHFYLYDAASEEIKPILEEERNTVPAISPNDLSHRIPFEFTAGDGLLIHAFVTFPKGVDLSQAPMIALIHGGPFGQVDSQYTFFSSFLANRGYIVYQPNFRVSTGYGKEYIERGNRDFGNGVIQQDILDGLNYLLDQGIGNRDRLGISGGSFGGFAVLTGLAYTPELFKAGFALVPPADVLTPLTYQLEIHHAAEEDPMVVSRAKKYFGDYEDKDYLEQMFAKSPQASLATISAPLFLMAGGKDLNVPVSHVKEYSLQLLDLDKRFSLVIDPDMAHGGWPDFETGAVLYLMEKFLSLYLGGSSQSADDPKLIDYISDNMAIDNNPEFLQAIR